MPLFEIRRPIAGIGTEENGLKHEFCFDVGMKVELPEVFGEKWVASGVAIATDASAPTADPIVPAVHTYNAPKRRKRSR